MGENYQKSAFKGWRTRPKPLPLNLIPQIEPLVPAFLPLGTPLPHGLSQRSIIKRRNGETVVKIRILQSIAGLGLAVQIANADGGAGLVGKDGLGIYVSPGFSLYFAPKLNNPVMLHIPFGLTMPYGFWSGLNLGIRPSDQPKVVELGPKSYIQVDEEFLQFGLQLGKSFRPSPLFEWGIALQAGLSAWRWAGASNYDHSQNFGGLSLQAGFPLAQFRAEIQRQDTTLQYGAGFCFPISFNMGGSR